MTGDRFRHGENGYGNHGCRCATCRAGHRDYIARWRARRGLPARISAEQCAELIGVTVRTWWSYTSTGRARAPRPCGWDPDTGRRVWDTAEVRHWIASRPGRGTRTDLDR